MEKAKHLSVDIETYSDQDIGSVGLYRYVDTPAFEILLFAYSYDFGPVTVIDLTQGEPIPQDVLDALQDPEVIKHAYNAVFEITCLNHAGIHTPTDQWRCTMLQGLYLGYPAGLANLGKALGLPEDKQKMSVGKALIRYFCVPCKPTKKNGGRTRNLPKHDPEKWELFKTYNGQDVITEMEDYQRLKAFPVPDDVQRDWVIDYELNLRGIQLDMDLVHGALQIDAANREQLTRRAIELTGLPNPNSRDQLLSWLKENGVDLPALTKETVAQGLETAKGPAAEVLDIRRRLAKSSVSKYQAMERAVCHDGRIRGTLQYYGAGRTGRWCLTGDHEVLTPKGWVRLDQWSDGPIACWAPATEALSFQASKALQFDYSGPMYSIQCQRCDQLSTPDHKMAVLGRDGVWQAKTVADIFAYGRFKLPFTGRRPVDSEFNTLPIRIMIMTQADGHYTDDALRFRFKRQRKIERCKYLLRRAGIPYSEEARKDGTTAFSIKRRHLPLWLRMFRDKTFGPWLLNESPEAVFEELELWDGSRCGPNSIQYVTTNRQNADLIQALAVLSGMSASLLMKKRQDPWSTAYVVNVWLTPGRSTEVKGQSCKVIAGFSGKVYCAETETGYFLVRRNGKVWITGNSGRLVQVQNLPHDVPPAMETARKLVKEGSLERLRLLYDNVSDTLSQLIRTCFIAKPGCTLVVADFSAIEARILAWLADEKWRMKVFAEGGDIYCASASSMFGMPVVKHGINGHLRQKGKVAELALGYGGGVNALIAMGALKMGLTEDELPEIVQKWRKASPHIRQYWYTVEEAAYKALDTATPQSIGHGMEVNREGNLLYGYDYLTIKLPSGRKLYYPQPSKGTNRFGNTEIKYKSWEGVRWVSLGTYSGKLVENITQAFARDCLALALRRLVEAGYKPLMHIHDEVVLEVPKDQLHDDELDRVVRLMCAPIPWAPGLLLNADGFISPYYKKDSG